MYVKFDLFQFVSPCSLLCLSLYVSVLAAFLRSVKPWPPVRKSPYGPTAGLFSLSLPLSACVCVCVHVLSFISVSSLSAAIGLAVSAPVCSFALGPAAGVWVSLDQVQHIHTHTHTCSHLVQSIQHPSNPIPDPSSSHAASLNSTALSANLFHSPSQHRPGASGDQRSHPPPLTAALCQATCLARAGWGVARRLDNNFSRWNEVRSRLGTLTREECPGLIL